MQSARPVLIVEDDPGVSAMINAALTRDGWQTVTAKTLAEGRARLRDDQPCIAVVDLGLPDGNGIAFVREASGQGRLGIIVVSGRGDAMDRVIGLEVGADDYLAKPFSPREMVARVRALSRRLEPQVPTAEAPAAAELDTRQAWRFGSVNLEPARHRLVDAEGAETRLTGGEARLLSLLLTQQENLADRETISERVLGRRLLPEQRGVDQLASNLRQKLHEASAGRITLAAVRGRGYRLVW
ncbi:response regulator transcription factor [Falsiroseomonas tokyonensis]|uniref:Response regulator transcription factor n=1 Tax=Falsiroseomonas tokyonensis TaxID=430521 RepID=A0ABV7BQQ1_9PROT|nr:response regulator transcription factor [Falsiroseomonas tokyonensis]MBU8537342.1 response regulator transcription factor [Falsiroseomonas tokyonensis]